MTLLELLIVLIVMVGLLAIAWPSLSRPLADDGLRRAAGVLREEIGLARKEAMQRGQPIVMRLELRTGRGSVAAWQQLISERTDLAPRRASTRSGGSNSRDADHPAAVESERMRHFDLPESVEVVAVTDLLSESNQLLPEPEIASGSAWLVFLPDGRSTSRSIVLIDRDRGRQLELRYDAVAGLAELGRVGRVASPLTDEATGLEGTR